MIELMPIILPFIFFMTVVIFLYILINRAKSGKDEYTTAQYKLKYEMDKRNQLLLLNSIEVDSSEDKS